MSIVRKSDIKNHLSARYRKEIHLDKSVDKSEVADSSEHELDARQANPTNFNNDFLSEHSSVDAPPAPSAEKTDLIVPQRPGASKSGQR